VPVVAERAAAREQFDGADHAPSDAPGD
jgi:hypothetical protein